MKKIMKITIYFMTFILLLSISFAGYGTVLDYQKISDTAGNFLGTLDDSDYFGSSVSSIGDLDNDGIIDVAVGAAYDDDGGANHGAVWILFLNTDGTVKSYQKISNTEGGFSGTLDNGDYFGVSVSGIGDLDNDGVDDIAVGARNDDDGGCNHGAVWILFLNADGTVKDYQKISDTEGNFSGILDFNDYFGSSVSSIGDLDNDGVEDLAVGAYGDDDGGTDIGAIWILFLNADGTVKNYQKISDTAGGFSGTLDDSDEFGHSVSSIGDLDNDGVEDLAVGAKRDDDGGTDKGAVWILFLNPNGTVKNYQKISSTAGNFSGILDINDYFGNSVSSIGDLDNDGFEDIAVGASGDDDGGNNRGAVWILFLNPDGTVKNYQKISSIEGNFGGTLSDEDYFGISVSSIGDLDNNSFVDLAVGAVGDDDGGTSRGAVWILSINSSIETGTIPIFSEFNSPETTNFSDPTEVPDITSVDKPVLANNHIKIKWLGNNLDLSGADLDSAIDFEYNFVSVDSSALPVLNSSANITFKTVSYPNIFSYTVLKNGKICSDCVKYSANPVKFRVNGFSNYTTNSTGVVPEFSGSSLVLISVFVIILGLLMLNRNRK